MAFLIFSQCRLPTKNEMHFKIISYYCFYHNMLEGKSYSSFMHAVSDTFNSIQFNSLFFPLFPTSICDGCVCVLYFFFLCLPLETQWGQKRIWDSTVCNRVNCRIWFVVAANIFAMCPFLHRRVE
jgi:hypothetical protein